MGTRTTTKWGCPHCRSTGQFFSMERAILPYPIQFRDGEPGALGPYGVDYTDSPTLDVVDECTEPQVPPVYNCGSCGHDFRAPVEVTTIVWVDDESHEDPRD